MRITFLTFLVFILITPIFSQKNYFENLHFTEADTLRGMLRPERTCYDVTFYDLQIKVNIEEKFISGYNEIHFKAMSDFTRLQIDLFENMKINRIVFEEKDLDFERKFNAVFINFPKQKKGVTNSFTVHYEGTPIAAKNAPWDGGFTWAKDKEGNPWVAVSCEGIGASLWFPNKDHLSDEPDSVRIGVAVPNGLTCISNGNLEYTKEENDYTRFNWFVSYPINNYNITLNITKYSHFSDIYKSKDGEALQLDYYVLPENLHKAKNHFQQVKPMLACYEKYFGKYPFWKDGYALVETPYLGMEHQGAIAYGNKYMRGYLGGLLPKGIDFDYIVIHESGHEYWGNSVSCGDHAEMWIHESFCTYSEALYVEYMYDHDDAIRYLISQKPFIKNRKPLLGPMNVNYESTDSDIYYKGAWILQTLRAAIHDDKIWFGLLKAFYQKHQHSVITSQDFIDFVNDYTKGDWTPFFNQYLRHPKIPTLLYQVKQTRKNLEVYVKWETDVEDFDMPVLVGKPGNYKLIHPTTKRSKFCLKKTKLEDFQIAEELFLINAKKID